MVARLWHRRGRGLFVPASNAAPTDPYINFTKLIAGNENGSGTSFLDQSPSAHTLTANGNAVWDATTAPAGLTSSIKLDGTGDYLSTPDSADWAFGPNDFAMEIFVKYTVAPAADKGLIAQAVDATGAGAFMWLAGFGGSKLDGYYTTGGTVATRRDVDNSAWAPGTTLWHHLAWSRSTTSMFMYIDGVQHGLTFNSGADSMFDAALQLCLGADSNGLAATNGNIAGIRITNGSNRGYTGASIVVPTLPYPTQ